MATTAIPETAEQNTVPMWMNTSAKKMEAEIVAIRGEQSRERARRGINQVAQFWRDSDGDQSVFEEFVRAHFAAGPSAVDALFQRFEILFEQLDGHMHEIYRTFREQLDLDLGPVLPVDEMFGGYYPGAHMTDDMFDNKLGFVVLLNFPLTTLGRTHKRCSPTFAPRVGGDSARTTLRQAHPRLGESGSHAGGSRVRPLYFRIQHLDASSAE